MKQVVFYNQGGASIDITDEIGFFGVTAQDFKAQVEEIGNQPITLNISSFGGNVDEAMAIYNVIKAHPGRVTAKVFGSSASAATLIALAADRVEMSENVFFLIHNVWTAAVGDSGELRKVADTMDKFNDQIVSIYMKKTGRSESTIRKWMDAEEWWSASEAKSKGFIDKVVEPSNSVELQNALMNCANEDLKTKLINKSNQMEEKSLLEKIWNKLSTQEEEVVETTEVEEASEVDVTETEEFKNAVSKIEEGLAKELADLKASIDAGKAKDAEVIKNLEEENKTLKASKTEVIGDENADEEKKEEALNPFLASVKNRLGKRFEQIN